MKKIVHVPPAETPLEKQGWSESQQSHQTQMRWILQW